MVRKWMLLGMALILVFACAVAAAESAKEILQQGIMYYDGVGVERDVDKAAQLFLKAAEMGNVDAMAYMGTCYIYGEGVEENRTEALKWVTLAAKGGDEASMITLASYYEDEDPETSFKWVKRAAELGNIDAMSWLAYCYSEGVGTEKDAAKAKEWHRRAGDTEDSEREIRGYNYQGH